MLLACFSVCAKYILFPCNCIVIWAMWPTSKWHSKTQYIVICVCLVGLYDSMRTNTIDHEPAYTLVLVEANSLISLRNKIDQTAHSQLI